MCLLPTVLITRYVSNEMYFCRHDPLQIEAMPSALIIQGYTSIEAIDIVVSLENSSVHANRMVIKSNPCAIHEAQLDSMLELTVRTGPDMYRF
jgi:hypothetical protein